MLMKNILLIIFESILFSGCNSLQGQNKDVEEFVKIVIETYNEKNSVKFNQLINKNTGLVFITTMGSNNTWLKVHKVCLSKKCLQTNSTESIGIPYQSFLEGYKVENLNLNKIEFTEKSFFECEKIEKYGVFVSSKDKFHSLSGSVSFFIKNYSNIIGEKIDSSKKKELDTDLKKFRKIELTSRRVTMNSKGGTFVFYITNIAGKWYLTIIDFASMDCSV